MTCIADHLDTNKPVEVKVVSSITKDKVATAQWPLGYPTIAINDSLFLKLPQNIKQFIYYHECAHLKFKNDDEHMIDCKSIDMLTERHNYSKLDIRKLINSLAKEFGLSKRWSKLLQCDGFQNAG